jgi:membrane protein implicated in regulation of membrane protease activity
MQMTALIWLYAGLGLILFEIMTPGFVTLFFGLAALTVALVVWLAPGISQSWQWLGFSVLSVLYIVLLRKSLKNVFSGSREVSEGVDDGFTGRMAVVTEAVAPNRPGRVELGSTTWWAESAQELPVGAAVKVLGKKNLTLSVEAV